MTEVQQKKEEIQRACDQLAAQLKEEVDIIETPNTLIPSSEKYRSVASLATEMDNLRAMSEDSSKRTKEMRHFESLCVQPVKFKFSSSQETEYVLRRNVDGFHIERNGKKIHQVDDDEARFKRPGDRSCWISGAFTFEECSVTVAFNFERDDALSVTVY